MACPALVWWGMSSVSRNGVAERDRRGAPRQLGRKKRRRETLVEPSHHSALSSVAAARVTGMVLLVILGLRITVGGIGGEVDASVRTPSMPILSHGPSSTKSNSRLTSSMFAFKYSGRVYVAIKKHIPWYKMWEMGGNSVIVDINTHANRRVFLHCDLDIVLTPSSLESWSRDVIADNSGFLLYDSDGEEVSIASPGIDVAQAAAARPLTSVWHDLSNEPVELEEYELECVIVSPYSIVKITLSPHWGFVRALKVYLPSPPIPGSCNSPLESDDRCGDDRCCGGTADADCDIGEFNPSTCGCLHAIRACLGRDRVAGVYDSLPPNNNSSLFGFSCKGDDVIVDSDGDAILDGNVCDGGGASSSDWCFGNLKECVKALWSWSLSGYCRGYRQVNGGDDGEDGGGGGGGARDGPGPGGGPGGGEAGEDKNVTIYSFCRFPPEIPSDIEIKHVVLVGPYQDDEEVKRKYAKGFTFIRATHGVTFRCKNCRVVEVKLEAGRWTKVADDSGWEVKSLLNPKIVKKGMVADGYFGEFHLLYHWKNNLTASEILNHTVTFEGLIQGESAAFFETRLVRSSRKTTRRDNFHREAPTIDDLLGTGDTFKLINNIACSWRTIGETLGIERATLDSYQDDLRRNKDRTRMVFDRWLSDASQLPHSDEYPLSWPGLYALLKDSQLVEVAKQYFDFMDIQTPPSV